MLFFQLDLSTHYNAFLIDITNKASSSISFSNELLVTRIDSDDKVKRGPNFCHTSVLLPLKLQIVRFDLYTMYTFYTCIL